MSTKKRKTAPACDGIDKAGAGKHRFLLIPAPGDATVSAGKRDTVLGFNCSWKYPGTPGSRFVSSAMQE